MIENFKYYTIKTNLRKDPKKWLVTGAAGFIGSHLVEHLLCNRQTVIGIDNFSNSSFETVQQIKKIDGGNFIFHEIDYNNINNILCGVDYVIHLGSRISVQESLIDPIGFFKNNVAGFVQLLNDCIEYDIKKLVYASSSAIYGEQTNDQFSIYGADKRSIEAYANAYMKNFNIETVGLRFFNVYGPRQKADSPYSAVIPIFIDALKKDKPPTIFGGSQYRDFVYVMDVIQALILASVQPICDKSCFDICGDSNQTSNVRIKDLFYIIQNILGSKVCPIIKERKRGDILYSSGDNSYAKSSIGYNPEFSFDEGLRFTIGL